MTIQRYIIQKLEDNWTTKEVAEYLDVTPAMISIYKKRLNPSLEVARKVYQKDAVVLFPFSEEGVSSESVHKNQQQFDFDA